MILIKMYYKTYNQDLLVIIKIFKIWHYYLKDKKFEVLVFTNQNNLNDLLI